MLFTTHPDICRQLAADRHAELERTAHIARLVRQARDTEHRPRHRRHRHRH